ncbi:MAG: heat-shock protein HtpX [Acidimicrobiales bacterium mtb01]|nr:arsenate reductase ArsC [Actinomycetota bacterium]TEX46463.1 MAG: heat-shock protein HtpX [Acidimicrobiales bacterium mtb01]
MPGILFLCIHNAGRSQMAAGFARAIGDGRVDIFSGGSEPADQVNPAAVEVMREVGIDIAGFTPQKFTDELLHRVDVVVTMGCGDSCPYVPGKRYIDWPLDDPKGQSADVARRIRDEIRGRVEALVAELTP